MLRRQPRVQRRVPERQVVRRVADHVVVLRVRRRRRAAVPRVPRRLAPGRPVHGRDGAVPELYGHRRVVGRVEDPDRQVLQALRGPVGIAARQRAADRHDGTSTITT